MKSLSRNSGLEAIELPLVSKAEAKQILRDCTVCFAVHLFDGAGSLFWLAKEGSKKTGYQHKLLVLQEPPREMTNSHADWVWEDMLSNTVGYVLDTSHEIEKQFYAKLGTHPRSLHAAKMGSAKSEAKATAARANGAKGGRPPNAKTREAMIEADEIVRAHRSGTVEKDRRK